jgi:hypothetical protein
MMDIAVGTVVYHNVVVVPAYLLFIYFDNNYQCQSQKFIFFGIGNGHNFLSSYESSFKEFCSFGLLPYVCSAVNNI